MKFKAYLCTNLSVIVFCFNKESLIMIREIKKIPFHYSMTLLKKTLQAKDSFKNSVYIYIYI